MNILKCTAIFLAFNLFIQNYAYAMDPDEIPVINLHATNLLTDAEEETLNIAALAAGLKIATGITLFYFDVNPYNICTALIGGGIFTAHGTWAWYQRKIVNKKVFQDTFVENAKKAIQTARKQPWHVPLSDGVLTQVCQLRQTNDKPALCSLLADITQEPLLTSLLSEDEVKSRMNKAKLVCKIFRRLQLTKDVRYIIIAHCPELIANYSLLKCVVSHIRNKDLLKETIVHCPFEWFSRYYHKLKTSEHKLAFSEEVATCATEIRMSNLLPFMAVSTDLLGEADITKTKPYVAAFNAYQHRITALPLPEK